VVRFLLRLTLFLTLLFALAVATAQTGSTWQYDFRTGDHLVYNDRLTLTVRRAKSKPITARMFSSEAPLTDA